MGNGRGLGLSLFPLIGDKMRKTIDIENDYFLIKINEGNVLSSALNGIVEADKGLSRRKRRRNKESKKFALAVLENARQKIEARKWANKQVPTVTHQMIVEGMTHKSPLTVPFIEIDTGKVWKRKSSSVKLRKAPLPAEADEGITPEDMSLHYSDWLKRVKEKGKGFVETAELFTEISEGD
jgi:hypothetical protein